MRQHFLELSLVFSQLVDVIDLILRHFDRVEVILCSDHELSILEVQVGDIVITDTCCLDVMNALVRQTGFGQIHYRNDIFAVRTLEEGILRKELVLDQILEDCVELLDLIAARRNMELASVRLVTFHNLLHFGD